MALACVSFCAAMLLACGNGDSPHDPAGILPLASCATTPCADALECIVLPDGRSACADNSCAHSAECAAEFVCRSDRCVLVATGGGTCPPGSVGGAVACGAGDEPHVVSSTPSCSACEPAAPDAGIDGGSRDDGGPHDAGLDGGVESGTLDGATPGCVFPAADWTGGASSVTDALGIVHSCATDPSWAPTTDTDTSSPFLYRANGPGVSIEEILPRPAAFTTASEIGWGGSSATARCLLRLGSDGRPQLVFSYDDAEWINHHYTVWFGRDALGWDGRVVWGGDSLGWGENGFSLDAANHAHLMNAGHEVVGYTTNASGTWVSENLPQPTVAGTFWLLPPSTRIAIEPSGQPHILVCGRENLGASYGPVVLVHATRVGGVWSFESLAPDACPGIIACPAP